MQHSLDSIESSPGRADIELSSPPPPPQSKTVKSASKMLFVETVAQVHAVSASTSDAERDDDPALSAASATGGSLDSLCSTPATCMLERASSDMAAACHLFLRPCGRCATRSDLDDRRRAFRDLLLLDPVLRDRCAVELSEPHELACVTVSGRLHAAQMDQLLRYVRRGFTCYRSFGVASTGTASEAHSSAIIRQWSHVAGSGAGYNGGTIDLRGAGSAVGVWFMRCGETGGGRTMGGGMIRVLGVGEGREQRFACDRCGQLESTAAEIVRHFQQVHGQQTEHESLDRILALTAASDRRRRQRHEHLQRLSLGNQLVPQTMEQLLEIPSSSAAEAAEAASPSPSPVLFEGQATSNWLGYLMAVCCCSRTGGAELDA